MIRLLCTCFFAEVAHFFTVMISVTDMNTRMASTKFALHMFLTYIRIEPAQMICVAVTVFNVFFFINAAKATVKTLT